jgi:hypothetical protein
MHVGRRILQVWQTISRPDVSTGDWCGRPPRHTVGRASKAGDTCTVCGTVLEREAPTAGEPATDAVWRCPRCGTCYHEPGDVSADRGAAAP